MEGTSDGKVVGAKPATIDGNAVGDFEGLVDDKEDDFTDGDGVGISEGALDLEAVGVIVIVGEKDIGVGTDETEGTFEGMPEGAQLGKVEGSTAGLVVGIEFASVLGRANGNVDGLVNGIRLGNEDGINDGDTVGLADGVVLD